MNTVERNILFCRLNAGMSKDLSNGSYWNTRDYHIASNGPPQSMKWASGKSEFLPVSIINLIWHGLPPSVKMEALCAKRYSEAYFADGHSKCSLVWRDQHQQLMGVQ